jgi:acyl carrier protein phosphodiesterase
MNFLAHTLLAGSAPSDRLGAMLGDFVKGHLPAGLPTDVAAGVDLHRRIDSFADGHPVFRRSRGRVSPERRRYAGIMIDMFYDHFLARHWQRYCRQPLEDFTADIYTLLIEHHALLPPRLARILPPMQADDWLSSYRQPETIDLALNRMAQRLSRPEGLAGSAAELAQRYHEFERDFLDFFPDAQAFSAAFLQAGKAYNSRA